MTNAVDTREKWKSPFLTCVICPRTGQSLLGRSRWHIQQFFFLLLATLIFLLLPLVRPDTDNDIGRPFYILSTFCCLSTLASIRRFTGREKDSTRHDATLLGQGGIDGQRERERKRKAGELDPSPDDGNGRKRVQCWLLASSSGTKQKSSLS